MPFCHVHPHLFLVSPSPLVTHHMYAPRAPSLLTFQTSALQEPLPFDVWHIYSLGAWIGGRDWLGHVLFYWVQQKQLAEEQEKGD